MPMRGLGVDPRARNIPAVEGSTAGRREVKLAVVNQPREQERQMHTIDSSDTGALAPIALGPDEGEARWFLGTLVSLKSTHESTGGRVAVMENYAPRGSGSPLHVHHNEDEWFYVIEGELTLWVGGRTVTAPAGSFVYGPRDIPHTFTVSSDEARFLLVTEPAGFENFMLALSEPAQRFEIRPPPPRRRTWGR